MTIQVKKDKPILSTGLGFLLIICFHVRHSRPSRGGTVVKNPSACQCRRLKRCGFDPWARKIPWSRKWQSTPIFLAGEPHRQRSLVGYSAWGLKESDTTEHLCTQPHTTTKSKLFSIEKEKSMFILEEGN